MANMSVLSVPYYESVRCHELDQFVCHSSSGESNLQIHLQNLKTLPVIAFFTHPEEYIEQDGEKFSFFGHAFIIDGVWLLQSIIRDSNTHDHFTHEYVAESFGEILEFIKRSFAALGIENKQILTFDQDYPDEYIQKILAEWLNSI
jgi:hypothetical protein